MGRKVYLSFFALVFSTFFAQAQTGEIRGTITESGGIAVPFASIAAIVNGIQVQAAIADIDGQKTF